MRFKTRLYLSLFGALLLLSSCQNDPRTPNNTTAPDPTGWFSSSNLSKGVFFAAAADPSSTDVIYAGSSAISVYRTDNGGALWNPARLGLPLSPVRSLFVDPTNPTNLYAGLPGRGVFLSTDKGNTWQPLNTGLANTDVYAVAYNPHSAPTGAQVTSSNTANFVHWNAVPNAELYEIFFCVGTVDCPGTTPANDPAAHWASIPRINDDLLKTTLSHTGLTNGTAYYYMIRARVAGINSPFSSKVSAVAKEASTAQNPPDVPYPNNVTITAGNNDILLSWDAIVGVPATYTIYKSGTPIDPSNLPTTPLVSSQTSVRYSDTAATNGVAAYYAIIAHQDVITTPDDPNTPNIDETRVTNKSSTLSAQVSAVPQAMTALFVGTGGGGVFASGPAGEFRSTINGPGLDTADAQDLSSLLIDPATLADPLPTLYAGTRGGVYRTLNGGGSWVPVGGALPPVLSLVQNGSTLFAGTASGIYQAAANADGSSPWTFLANANQAVTSIAVDPSDPATLYATSATAGIFKTSDGGATWAASNQGLTVLDIRSIVVHPKNRNLLYAGGVGAFFKSTNGGSLWTQIDLGTLENVSNPLPTSNVQTLAATPGVGSLLYAGGDAGVFKSADQGKGWVAMNSQLGANTVMALQVNPARPAVLYAAVADLGIYKSLDGGAGWRLENGQSGSAIPQNVTTLILDPSDPTRFYAGTSGLGVYRGTDGPDGHLSWTRETGLNDTALDSGSILSLAATAGSATTVYAGTFQNGVFRRVDDGVNGWEKIGGPLSDKSILALAVHPQRAATLYAGSSSGLYTSEDGGSTWAPVSSLQNVEVRSISFDSTSDPARPLIYAGTTSGVYKSANGGAGWVHMNDGMAASVAAILVDPQQPAAVYAGTLSTGLFKRTR